MKRAALLPVPSRKIRYCIRYVRATNNVILSRVNSINTLDKARRRRTRSVALVKTFLVSLAPAPHIKAKVPLVKTKPSRSYHRPISQFPPEVIRPLTRKRIQFITTRGNSLRARLGTTRIEYMLKWSASVSSTPQTCA